MGKTELFAAICAIPLILLIPQKLKSKLSFLIVAAVSVISSMWAVHTFRTGPVSIPLFDVAVIGELTIQIDYLSALFIGIINLITLAGSFYAMGYLDKEESQSKLNLNLVSLNLLHLSMILVTCFQNLLAFLIVWELMTLFSFLLLLFDTEQKENIRGALIYFVQMHVGAIFLMIAFMWSYKITNALSFETISLYFSNPKHNNLVLFLLLFAGFGTKAGIVPFHSWLPRAYHAAPPHVAGIMSGVMTKMGLYGLLRTLLVMHNHETAIGMILLCAGIISGLYGIINAIVQKDMKKSLGYSSIENIGIICMGIGTGMIGLGVGDHALSFFGFCAGILHLFNHSLFKSLLFFSTGSIYKQTGSTNLENLGGLMKKMPVSGILFLLASAAICALPPFNGFVSEFLLYHGYLEGLNATNIPVEAVLLVGLISLSLIGGLAIYSFTRLYGLSFLGSPRTEITENATEVNTIMLLPQLMLASLLLGLGIFPQYLFRLVSKVVSLFLSDYETFHIPSMESLNNISRAMLVFLAVFGLIYMLRNYFVKKNKTSYGPTWGCGYSGSKSRMQYTPASYAEFMTEFAEGLIKSEKKYEPIEATDIFPKDRALHITPKDIIEEGLIFTILKLLKKKVLSLFAFIQTGSTAMYILYAFIFLLVMFTLTFFNIIL